MGSLGHVEDYRAECGGAAGATFATCFWNFSRSVATPQATFRLSRREGPGQDTFPGYEAHQGRETAIIIGDAVGTYSVQITF